MQGQGPHLPPFHHHPKKIDPVVFPPPRTNEQNYRPPPPPPPCPLRCTAKTNLEAAQRLDLLAVVVVVGVLAEADERLVVDVLHVGPVLVLKVALRKHVRVFHLI